MLIGKLAQVQILLQEGSGTTEANVSSMCILCTLFLSVCLFFLFLCRLSLLQALFSNVLSSATHFPNGTEDHVVCRPMQHQLVRRNWEWTNWAVSLPPPTSPEVTGLLGVTSLIEAPAFPLWPFLFQALTRYWILLVWIEKNYCLVRRGRPTGVCL